MSITIGRKGPGRGVRQQFPITLGFAATIHKVQGKTLDRIVVTMGKQTFRAGQAYVAFSRVRTLDGLFIVKFNPASIITSPSVTQEMDRLRGNEVAPLPRSRVFSEQASCELKICLLNVRSYREHLPDMKLDDELLQCDVR